MKRQRSTPSFAGRHPASPGARQAARGASKKGDTKCEVVLRRTIWAMGLRYRRLVPGIPGRPDLLFPRQRIAVFCDGDFWHGRDLESRLARLSRGHNAPYWVEKIRTNVQRDRAVSERLSAEGWHVVRLWETEILCDPVGAAAVVAAHLRNACTAAPNNRLQRTVRCAARR
jgi:DNA mismatch endonuclease (patch repair protein)